MTAEIKICLQNLGKYNEGELWFQWVQLPATEKKLAAAYDSIHVCHDGITYTDCFGNPYEELMIADVEDNIGLGIGEWSDIDELNRIAEDLDRLDENQVLCLKARMDTGDTLEEALENLDDCMIFWGAEDMEDVARQYAEETGLLDGVNEWVARYFDFRALGRDMEIEGVFYRFDNGYIEVIR